MAQTRTKKDIVKMLLKNKELENEETNSVLINIASSVITALFLIYAERSEIISVFSHLSFIISFFTLIENDIVSLLL